jgi:hypothetical protein
MLLLWLLYKNFPIEVFILLLITLDALCLLLLKIELGPGEVGLDFEAVLKVSLDVHALVVEAFILMFSFA